MLPLWWRITARDVTSTVHLWSEEFLTLWWLKLLPSTSMPLWSFMWAVVWERSAVWAKIPCTRKDYWGFITMWDHRFPIREWRMSTTKPIFFLCDSWVCVLQLSFVALRTKDKGLSMTGLCLSLQLFGFIWEFEFHCFCKLLKKSIVVAICEFHSAVVVSWKKKHVLPYILSSPPPPHVEWSAEPYQHSAFAHSDWVSARDLSSSLDFLDNHK